MLKSKTCFANGNKNPYMPNLVAYYPFNSDATDLSGKGYNGTLIGSPPFNAGKVGNGIDFGNDSTIRYVHLIDNSDFSFTNGGGVDVPFTISMWVYKTASATTGNWLISKRDTTSLGDEYQLAATPTTLSIALFSSSGGYLNVTAPALSLSTWHHVVITYSGSKTAAGIKIYVGRTLQTMTDGSSGSYGGMPNGTANTRIGQAGWDSDVGKKHKGLIDEMYIWKGREMTSTEVTDIYNKGVAGITLI